MKSEGARIDCTCPQTIKIHRSHSQLLCELNEGLRVLLQQGGRGAAHCWGKGFGWDSPLQMSC
jgi:hypothetical protein